MDKCLSKKVKLKSKKMISSLFEDGESVKAFSLLLVYKKSEEIETEFNVGFSVSKRNFKNAVDRNRVKRLMRESFRKNKYLFAKQSKPYLFMFIFTGKVMPNHHNIFKEMEKLAKKFDYKLQSN